MGCGVLQRSAYEPVKAGTHEVSKVAGNGFATLSRCPEFVGQGTAVYSRGWRGSLWRSLEEKEKRCG